MMVMIGGRRRRARSAGHDALEDRPALFELHAHGIQQGHRQHGKRVERARSDLAGQDAPSGPRRMKVGNCCRARPPRQSCVQWPGWRSPPSRRPSGRRPASRRPASSSMNDEFRRAAGRRNKRPRRGTVPRRRRGSPGGRAQVGEQPGQPDSPTWPITRALMEVSMMMAEMPISPSGRAARAGPAPSASVHAGISVTVGRPLGHPLGRGSPCRSGRSEARRGQPRLDQVRGRRLAVGVGDPEDASRLLGWP